MSLSADQLRRYSRHLILPQVGIEGQEKLLNGRVLIIGVGGLGCPVSLYLAAAGVGRIGLVDPDRVDDSNLQRQVLYTTRDVGRLKVEAAADRLSALNPDTCIDPHPVRFAADNAEALMAEYDYIIDGTDNFPTRYLVNDACVLFGKVNVYGSIFRFDGQVSVFAHPDGPCYRCLYPEPPPPGSVPNCAEGGVLGILPGHVGLTQATQAVQLMAGIGEPLIGRLLCFDALTMRWETIVVRKNPDCPVCGERPTITELKEEEVVCAVEEDMPEGIERVSPKEAARRLNEEPDWILLDVREPYEYEIAHLPKARLIPLNRLLERINELSTDDTRSIMAYCHRGVRSLQALRLLKRQGFNRLVNMDGGIDRWSDEVDATVPKY